MGSVEGSIRVSVSGNGVSTVIIDRESKKNALTSGMFHDLAQTFRELEEDPRVRAIVLTGAGDAFCAGVDVAFFDEPRDAAEQKAGVESRIQRVIRALSDLSTPVVAGVNGPAVGAGCDLALMCDLRLAASSARFSTAYMNLGLSPGGGAAYILPRLVGLPRALELLLTGRDIDALEAEEMGIVHRVVPDDELRDATNSLAETIARNNRLMLRLTKRAVYESLSTDLRTSLDLASSHVAILAARHRHDVRKRRPGE